MDVNWFFLLILHNQALLKVTFGSWVLSALTTVAFSQMVTSTPPRGINLQMSFKKTCLMQREESIGQQFCKRAVSCKREWNQKSSGLENGTGWRLDTTGIVACIEPFFLFLFWLGLRPSRKASKGAGLNGSKLLLDILSHSACCVSFWSKIKLVPSCLLLLISLHTSYKSQSS